MEDRRSPLLVDVSAQWHNPSARITPLIDELAASYGEKVRFARLEYRHEETLHEEMVEELNAERLPLLIFMQDGKQVHRVEGWEHFPGKRSKKRSALEALAHIYLGEPSELTQSA